MNISQILGQLANVRKSGSGWTALCPAHEDKRNSLSITEGSDSRILVKCFAGCTFEKICAAKGWNLSDLFPQSNGNGNGSRKPSPRIVAEYDYPDERGDLLYQNVRYQPKDFRQRRPDGNGGWTWKLDGVRRVALPVARTAGRKRCSILGRRKGRRDWKGSRYHVHDFGRGRIMATGEAEAVTREKNHHHTRCGCTWQKACASRGRVSCR